MKARARSRARRVCWESCSRSLQYQKVRTMNPCDLHPHHTFICSTRVLPRARWLQLTVLCRPMSSRRSWISKVGDRGPARCRVNSHKVWSPGQAESKWAAREGVENAVLCPEEVDNRAPAPARGKRKSISEASSAPGLHPCCLACFLMPVLPVTQWEWGRTWSRALSALDTCPPSCS